MPSYIDDANAVITDDLYFETFQEKGVNYLRIKRTKNFSKLQNQSYAILAEHVWSQGDTLFRLSNKYYGTYSLWWTISLINQKPTDAHYNIGDVVIIIENPNQIETIMR